MLLGCGRARRSCPRRERDRLALFAGSDLSSAHRVIFADASYPSRRVSRARDVRPNLLFPHQAADV